MRSLGARPTAARPVSRTSEIIVPNSSCLVSVPITIFTDVQTVHLLLLTAAWIRCLR